MSESRRIQLTLTLTLAPGVSATGEDRIIDEVRERANAIQYVVEAGVGVPTPEVNQAPCIHGTVEIGDAKSEFLIPLANDSVNYSQWGASNTVLWPRVDLMDALSEAANVWAQENLCRTCGENLLDDGEGYDGECGDCADKTESEEEDE